MSGCYVELFNLKKELRGIICELKDLEFKAHQDDQQEAKSALSLARVKLETALENADAVRPLTIQG